MHRIQGVTRSYAWGSPDAIPELLDFQSRGHPVAELWFGAHPDAPSPLHQPPGSNQHTQDLRDILARDPLGALGEDVASRFGTRLPYLLKLIAPARALSLQVHPSLQEASTQFAREEAAGIARTDPKRNYRDDNHKPELVVALRTFEALCGFRAPRRALELLDGLDAAIARRLWQTLYQNPSPSGMRTAFSMLLEAHSRPTESEVTEFAAACANRLSGTSPSPRADSTVISLVAEHPGDPGVVASLLLNSVTLQPGEALFVPTGCVHAYLQGLGIEVMASSDNVLRAGLTSKHVDVTEAMRIIEFTPCPPTVIRPSITRSLTKYYRTPVADFDLRMIDLRNETADQQLSNRGPRMVLCLTGAVTIRSERSSLNLHCGDAAFIGANEGSLHGRGHGSLVQAGVPDVTDSNPFGG